MRVRQKKGMGENVAVAHYKTGCEVTGALINPFLSFHFYTSYKFKLVFFSK
jgi:hypothetical protein